MSLGSWKLVTGAWAPTGFSPVRVPGLTQCCWASFPPYLASAFLRGPALRCTQPPSGRQGLQSQLPCPAESGWLSQELEQSRSRQSSAWLGCGRVPVPEPSLQPGRQGAPASPWPATWSGFSVGNRGDMDAGEQTKEGTCPQMNSLRPNIAALAALTLLSLVRKQKGHSAVSPIVRFFEITL